MQSPTPGPAIDPEPRSPAPSAAQGAYLALAILFSMNLLNYVDRYVFSSLGKQIETTLHISHSDFSWLAGAFMLVYTLISPCVGWMGDRYSRRHLLALGVGIWSLATVGTGFAQTFWQMFLWRALLGVGEASYGVVAPPLLADLFSPKVRGRVMGVFYLALPLGGALGYWIGGYVGTHWGWRYAFWVVGLPGLLAAFAALAIRDPGRGASEGRRRVGKANRDRLSEFGPEANGQSAGKSERPRFTEYGTLFRTPSFLFNIAGMASVTFATGAYGNFAAIFYQEVRGMDLNDATVWIGGLTAAAGLIGIALGAWLADALLRFTRRAYLLWAGTAVLCAVPFGLGGILLPQRDLSLALLFVAMVLLASVLGPCNTVTANVVPANQRAAGYAVSIFLIHLFGDISSPILIGHVSDWLGRPDIADSWLGRFFAALGATPVPSPTGSTNLTAGMLLVVPMLVLGSFFFFLGSRYLPADQERARALGADAEADTPVFH
jgi:MFS family permease